MADAATYSSCSFLVVVCQVKGPFALMIVSNVVHCACQCGDMWL